MAYKNQVLVCGGTGCTSSSALKILEKMEKLLKQRGIKENVKIIKTGCFGLCAAGPIVIVYPDGAFYAHVKLEDVDKIVDEHIIGNKIVKDLLYKEAVTEDGEVKSFEEVPFYKKQMRIALENCGVIGAEDLDDYVEVNGYKALKKALTTMTPQNVIDEVKKSGLRGRGGGGFPTGLKWEFTYKADNDQKYVACNADEGDPGAFMDRSILEGDSHAVIEAMAIAGYAVGANQGYVYVRAEYPVAIERLQIAIDKAREAGYLGENIFGTDFEFDMEIRLGAGAFVCGEETALINSIEGKRGMPRPRPPFPAVKGLWNKPTLLNNVETYANIPKIILKGSDWFSSIGTEESKGTKVFALGGKVENVGLVEIPMGTTLREIIFEIGGGIPNNKDFKAVQTGGPSGGCLTEEYLDTPIDYESLTALGSMMGSGGMVVLDEDNCMVDIAKFFLEFTVEESCGKCPPCKIGTKRMFEILERITQGKGERGDIQKLEKLADTIKSTALCGLGQTAPNPVLSTLKYFRHEYEAHVNEKKCPSGVCQELTKYLIVDKCVGCTRCVKKCPVDAINGELKKKHTIDYDKCIKCGACQDNCPVKAIVKG